MKKLLLSLIVVITSTNLFSQCPSLTLIGPSTRTLYCVAAPISLTVTSTYTANVTSRWLAPGNIPILCSVSNGTMVVATVGAIGTYTAEFTDNSSMCVTTKTVDVVEQYSASPSLPIFSLSVSSYSQNCSNSTVTISISGAATSPTPGGGLSYTIGAMSPTYTTAPLFAGSASSVFNTCGNYRVVVHDNSNACETSYSIVVNCGTLSPSPLIISNNNTVCIGSSTDLSVSGASTYTWLNTSSNSPTINVLPTTTGNYSINATNSAGCITNSVFAVVVNTTCADVWPGDANSDGVVDNTDVFELGLWNANTGPARTFTSNVYNSQVASNWAGTVSTGKNQNHADCNGDGTIDVSDTLAIFNNFLQTHAFRSANVFATNPDISIVPTQTLVGANSVSSADIFLGDATNQINNIYGVAFDVQFDSALVQNNSVYISYNSSFLNAANTNINFKKTTFANQKVYATSVRTNGTNVSGNGKIATLYFKTKANVTSSSVLNLSVVNPKMITNTGAASVLTAGTSSIQLTTDVGIHENSNSSNLIIIFPNPAKEFLFINNNSKEAVTIEMVDLLGKSLLKTTLITSEKIDLKGLSSGIYFIKARSAKENFEKKIIIE